MQIPAWARVATAVGAVGWGANQFTPLLALYQNHLRLSAATTQATFACYVVGLIPGLLLGGPLADRYGRRAVLLPATVLSAVSAVALLAGHWGLGWLFTGRLVAGVASGAAFSAGAAWLKELSADAPAGAGARRATVAMTAGFGLGPLVAGLIAQWVPDMQWAPAPEMQWALAPDVLAYLPHLALVCGASALLWRTAEPGRRLDRAPASAPRTPWPRQLVRVVLPTAPWVFGSAAVALAYLPTQLHTRDAGYQVLFGTACTVLCALTGVAVQPLARRLAPRPLLVTALVTVAAGLLLGAAALAEGSPAVALLAAALLGAGYGLCLVFGLALVQQLAPPAQLGRFTSIFQACSYLGFTVTYLLAALRTLAPAPMLLAGTAGLALVTLAVTVLRLEPAGGRRRRPAQRPRQSTGR